MITTLASFLTVSLVLALIPGPDNIFVLTQAVSRGALAGIWVTIGLCTGLLVHTFAVVIGLAAVIAASATAFTLIKALGAAYLVFLAWKAFRSSASISDASAVSAPPSGAAYFRRRIIMNVTNPKVAMFFLAFLPQFANPAYGSVELQLVLLAGIFIVTTFFTFLLISFLAGSLRSILFRNPVRERLLNRAAGFIFLTLAGRLLLQRQ